MSDNDFNNQSIVKPVPDPSTLTTDQLMRAVQAERDYVNGQIAILTQRLNAMDEATKVLSETVTRTPTDIQKEVQHLRELTFEKLASVDTQFKERDTRSERESRDNRTAVDAAFAASKEAASEQNKSNTLAIGKSEAATTESINKLSELLNTTVNGLASNLSDLKTRVERIESTKEGADKTWQVLVTIIGVGIAIMGFIGFKN